MGQQQEVRPGDWRCPECSAHNYASKDACYRCQIPKCAPCLPVSLSRQGGSPCPLRAWQILSRGLAVYSVHA